MKVAQIAGQYTSAFHAVRGGGIMCSASPRQLCNVRERDQVPDARLCNRSGCAKAFRRAANKRPGGRMRIPRHLRTARDLIRAHLSESGLTISGDLAAAWQQQGKSALRTMSMPNKPLTPTQVAAVVRLCRLDDLDATELHLAAAREVGWAIDPARVLTNA